MNLFKENLPDGFKMIDRPDRNLFQVEFDAGEYDKYDALWAKYDIEPSGYAWEVVFSIYLKKHNPHLLKKIKFDCEGDSFNCYINSETDQIILVKHLIVLLENPALLDVHLQQMPEGY